MSQSHSASYRLSASEASQKIASGELTCLELVESCLERIHEREDAIGAWATLDAVAAIRKAKELDRLRLERSDDSRLPLEGIPIGVKDVIDTKALATQYGSSIYRDHVPQVDAACVERLAAAGAIILGKTVTAEFATYQPGGTANPLDIRRTPGGSSSGSAAAVADFHVPLAVGTQTAGSVIRPASFCGIMGFKPTRDRYPVAGMMATSKSLDTLGTFARTSSDLALLDGVLNNDAQAFTAQQEGTVPLHDLRLALCKTAAWPQASKSVHAAVNRCCEALRERGAKVDEISLPQEYAALVEAHKLIHVREAASELGELRRIHPDKVSSKLRDLIEEGDQVSDADYREATRLQRSCAREFAGIMGDADLLITPATIGPAPHGLDSTGDPIFCRLWTALGVPCFTFTAAFDGESGMPLGVQLVGGAHTDQHFLQACRTIEQQIGLNHDK
ncbi:MAG: amidase [Pseudomonadota bacterium]